jgi:xanthine dehydrogenase iron-sulfur cluster and FAD-binding subunit A
MILEYHRPQTVEDAVKLLSRNQPLTIPLAGGSTIHQQSEDVAVVDLQNLGLNQIQLRSEMADLGSMVTFQQLMEWEDAPCILVESAHRGSTYNLRNQITIGGAIASSSTFSPVVAALLALDARMTWQPGDVTLNLGEWLPIREAHKSGNLISSINVPLNIITAMEIISRTPEDSPQIIACGCKWPSGRTRIVTMLKDHSPVLMSDGRDVSGVELSSFNIDYHTGLFTEEYIQHSLTILIHRVMNRLQG